MHSPSWRHSVASRQSLPRQGMVARVMAVLLFFCLPLPWRKESLLRYSSPFHPLLIGVAAAFLLSLPACGDETEAQIGFSTDVLESDVYPHVRVTWEAPTLFGQQQQSVDIDKRHSSAGPFRTAQTGTLHVHFQLQNGDSPSTTTGSLDLPLRKDWRWGVDFIVSSASPMGFCFGCFDSEAFDIDPALGYGPDMKLWATWGGNSISHPVLY